MRILIADDHAIVRAGLKFALADTPDIVVAGEASNGEEVVSLARSACVDVVVLDISMPALNGLETLVQLRREFPALPVLMLSMYPEDELAVKAIRAGAAGYLSKLAVSEQLVQAIRHVAAGRRYISPHLAEELASAISSGDAGAAHEVLSAREMQTLCLIGSGKGLTRIATELDISVKTVSVYRARALHKLGLTSTAELIHYAIKHALAMSSDVDEAG
jgi:DNA-binding NarL/FixJ family response regulator